MKIHHVAALFPMMDTSAIEALASDIKAHGLHEPITVRDGVILDGRNRLMACQIAGVEPRFEAWDDARGDVAEWIVSKNIHRRHLTPACVLQMWVQAAYLPS